MFPRHVLEYMVRDGGSGLSAAVNSPAASNLARTHEGVTLMFMDIIGESEGMHVTMPLSMHPQDKSAMSLFERRS